MVKEGKGTGRNNIQHKKLSLLKKSFMDTLSKISQQTTKDEIKKILEGLLIPYAQELINSGGDFSYMNMYADNFMNQIILLSSFDEEEVFEILNESCENCWQKALGS